MIAYPAPLQAVGGARTGIAPVNLLDVLDVNGNFYFWSDRRIVAPNAGLSAASVAVVPASPPVTVPAGQSVAWSLPQSLSFAGSGGGTAAANLSSATLTISEAWSLTLAPESYALWSNFTVPALPPGAVISAIYPVIMLAGPKPGDGWLVGGSGLDPSTAILQMHGALMYPAPAAPGGEYSGNSLGTTLAAISSAEVAAYMWTSVTGYYNDSMQVSFVGLAIYYSMPGSGGSAEEGYFSSSVAPYGSGPYEPWILTIPDLTFHRSSVTDMGSFKLQNLSGDTISRDFEKIMRKSALEGAFFVYRCWQPDAQASWIEAHGTLTVEDVGVDTVTLKGAPAINPAQEDTPAYEYCETCQWRWSSPQCGAAGATECQYSYQTCQVLERIFVVLNNYEKNYGETLANVPGQVINRRRRF